MGLSRSEFVRLPDLDSASWTPLDLGGSYQVALRVSGGAVDFAMTPNSPDFFTLSERDFAGSSAALTGGVLVLNSSDERLYVRTNPLSAAPATLQVWMVKG